MGAAMESRQKAQAARISAHMVAAKNSGRADLVEASDQWKSTTETLRKAESDLLECRQHAVVLQAAKASIEEALAGMTFSDEDEYSAETYEQLGKQSEVDAKILKNSELRGKLEARIQSSRALIEGFQDHVLKAHSAQHPGRRTESTQD
jgi:hypothetical protein